MSDSNDYQPFGYIGRIPLYFSTILVLVYCVCLVALVFCSAFNGPDIATLLDYDSLAVTRGYQFWRFFSYPLVNLPSIWFALEMYLLYSFGREVERFIGRYAFAMMYLSIVALAPCLSTAVVTLDRTLWIHFFGSYTADFAVFIAFATIYPNAEIFFTFKAKWVAAVLIAIYSLQFLYYKDVVNLVLFWAACLAAFVFIKYLRGQIQFSLRNYLRLRRSRRVLKPLPRPRAASPMLPPKSERDDVIESIDPLLDKIAKHGISSLTASERARLEEARAELLKKPGP
jgi:membrane associated rhomboid family serine protease